ncbi:retrovirus-related pol polyprotein from transposon TNT 1-94 [Tanacetum coccineum]
MSNHSEDIQEASSDTRPPMLDRTDFESWKQNSRLYCKGEMAIWRVHSSSYNEGPFKKGKGLKESNHDQLYAYLKQHELHANENKMLMERLNQHPHDPRALVSNVSPYQYPSSSSVPPLPSYTPTVTYQPQFTDNTQLDTGNEGAQYRAGNSNSGQGKPIKCYNCNGIGHIARNYNLPKQPQNSDYFKEKMLLMQDQENGVDLDEERLLFLAGRQPNTFDDETMFMANLSSTDLVYDEAGPSYDSDTLSEVQDHDNSLDNMNEYHEEHEMQNDDNEAQVVQSDASSVPNDAVMMITNDIYEQDAQCVISNQPNKTFNASLTAELARYKELTKVYEKGAQFELN